MDLIVEWAPIIALMLMAGLAAGFAAGLFGIGGGFVVVPALFVMLPLLGGDMETIAHVAIGTSLATIVMTSLRSVQAHNRRGAVDFGILKSWAPFIVAGSLAGVLLASRVSGNVLATIFGVGVIVMAIHFLYPVLKSVKLGNQLPAGAGRAAIAGGLGASSALLGIGGGTVAIIVMTLYGRSIHQAIGTASGVGVIIALPSAIGFLITGLGSPDLPVGSVGYVNFPAALSIIAMSMLSAPWGAAMAHKLSPGILQRVFGLYLVFVGVVMIRNGLAG